MIRLMLVASAFLALGGALPAWGQATPSTTAEVLARLRMAGSPTEAATYLSQEQGTLNQAELDAFADSLVAIAVGFQGELSFAEHRVASAARSALLLAAHPSRLAERAAQRMAERLPPPVGYNKSLQALIRVYRGSMHLRGGTIYALTQLPDQRQVLEFLAGVATSRDPYAPSAIGFLFQDVGDAGIRVLRRLYHDGAVVEPTANENLRAIAYALGW